MLGFEAWFPLSFVFPQKLQAWSIKECEIYLKSLCCLFLTVSGAVLSSLAWSCLLLRIRSLSSCGSLPLFGMWCHQESQLFQSESLPLPSCSLVDCVESSNVCSNTERKGNVKKQSEITQQKSIRRDLYPAPVHSGCIWNQICYNSSSLLLEAWLLYPKFCFSKLGSERSHVEKRANWAAGETWQQGLSAPAGKMVPLIGFIGKNILKEEKCRR